jgi:hypothetical protein
MAQAGRLFHTIVVVGASVGCGSSSESNGFASAVPVYMDASTDTTAAFPASPSDCPQPAQFHCYGTGPNQCECNADAPNDICGCPRPGEFRCRDCLSTPPILGRCPNNDGVDCFCNADIAIAGPQDCPHPQQFTCASAPIVSTSQGTFASYGWFDSAECSCDSSKPLSVADCGDSGLTYFNCPPTGSCAAGTPGAETANIMADCACVPRPIPIL